MVMGDDSSPESDGARQKFPTNKQLRFTISKGQIAGLPERHREVRRVVFSQSDRSFELWQMYCTLLEKRRRAFELGGGVDNVEKAKIRSAKGSMPEQRWLSLTTGFIMEMERAIEMVRRDIASGRRLVGQHDPHTNETTAEEHSKSSTRKPTAVTRNSQIFPAGKAKSPRQLSQARTRERVSLSDPMSPEQVTCLPYKMVRPSMFAPKPESKTASGATMLSGRRRRKFRIWRTGSLFRRTVPGPLIKKRPLRPTRQRVLRQRALWRQRVNRRRASAPSSFGRARSRLDINYMLRVFRRPWRHLQSDVPVETVRRLRRRMKKAVLRREWEEVSRAWGELRELEGSDGEDERDGAGELSEGRRERLLGSVRDLVGRGGGS